MALNDFLKKAKDAASSAAATAKAKIEEQKEKMAAEKEERERIRAEKQAATDSATAQMLEDINAQNGGLFDVDAAQLQAFTADFYDKLYLPAHSVSASKLIFHPMDKKMEKYAQKDFPAYSSASESPVLMILGKGSQKVFLTTKALYFKKAFEEDGAFYCEGSVEIGNIGSLTYEKDGENYVVKCNGVTILNGAHGFELDINAFAEYIKRIQNKNFTITNEQIDALIKEKIGENILKIVNEYVYSDELLLYFAWGGDSITAKDFIVCSNKQMVVLNREAFGLTKNVKQFYYEDVTSMATLQETNGLLDLALTAAFSLCDLEVSVAGAKEKVSTLFTYEAEKVVKVYRDCRRDLKESSKQPQVVVQQAAPAGDDPLAQLEKLNKLKEAGIVTEEEFAAKKADLLSKL